MPRILISFEDNVLMKEIKRIISNFNYFEISEINTFTNLNSTLKTFLHKNELHFLIYTKNLNHKSVNELQELSSNFPWVFSIYYHSNLKNKQFHALHDSGVNSCIIGTQRTEYLNTNLPVFWEKHWKRIPSFIYPKDEKNLSPRAKLIIRNIENHHIREFNIKSLSENLKISEPHFRSVFKDLFEINFQEFKQKLLAYYESKLLFEQKIKPKIVSSIFNYGSFNNFCRSFKLRHGGGLRKLNNRFRRVGGINYVNKVTFLVLIIITSVVLSGCAQKSLIKNQYQRYTSIEQKAKQTLVPEYKLGFGDVVEIKFFNNEQFNEIVSVRPDGRITMEKIGDIFVTGVTPSQLDSLITVTYAEIILNPDVTVFVRQFGGYKIYVLGEVNSSGGYALERNMTVLQALAAAGGYKTSAKLGNVMILRQGKNGVVNVLKIDVADYLDGEFRNFETKDLYLQPQDIIYVTSTFFADVNTFLKQVYDGLLPPADVYLRALFWSDR